MNWIGYSRTTNSDQFRISVEYRGKGESQYLRLSLQFVSGDTPILVSQWNLDVIETQTIIGRDYVDGLKGEVLYNLPRLENNSIGSLTIYNYNSDVEVLVPNYS